jgi:decaprenyl-phosphate phosphoribosyltransferase
VTDTDISSVVSSVDGGPVAISLEVVPADPITVELSRSDVAAGVLRAMRPHQWPKNFLVAAAPAAAGELFHPAAGVRVAAMFGVFCLASSAVYLLNDVIDADVDRLHPKKRFRPIAAGVVPKRLAIVVAAVLAVVSLVAAVLLEPLAGGLVAAYLAISAAYCFGLKDVAVIDLVNVASGFVLRAGAGAAALSIPVSSLFLTVMAFGALAMAAGKRSSELAAWSTSHVDTRPVLASYTPSFLLQVEAIAIGGALTGYVLWAFEVADGTGRSPFVDLSVVPFALALLRYLLLVSRGEAEAPEEAILSDRVLAIAGGCWAVLFLAGVS